jgi:hypothetical protein|tara:strand:+ start:501 stop:1193 length:693 start_codon:yes stop_codon:yes gene_type:complete
MAFGFNYDSSAGDIIPIVKFDARAGRFFRIDRTDGVNNPVDITSSFKAVMDFENIEVGFIHFPAGSAPEFKVAPIGQPMPENPGGKFRQGIRMMLKLGKDCGGDVREIASTAKAVLGAFDNCHTEYMVGAKANAGKLPVVALETTVPIVTQGRDEKGNAVKTTNYAPVFKIVSWIDRPTDLVFTPKNGGDVARAPAQAAPAQAAPASPPSTGSTQVSAPAAAVSSDDDFG